ncbi:uncharacterized protein [Phyllobates terribilis]|uniref:uncharacterized protein isoform X1 n=1 Tax=Phyllobates terribilis TaxID=111132 RepID=UPI003CCB11A9
MSSVTFSYNADEASNIISQTNLSSEFLRVPPSETRGRDLEKERRHLTNIELHCATLTEYLRVQRIPRGLRAITTTKEQIKNIESQLTTSISPEDLQTLQSKIQTNIDLHKRDTETRKRNKFARDLQDYEQNRVYRWRDNPSTNKYTHRTAKSSTDYTSSGSDMDQRQSTIQSVPFLGQTRRRPNRRRRGEAIGTRGNLDFTRITRSQTHNW